MRKQAHKTTRMTIDISDIAHKKLKAIAAIKGVTLRDLIIDCIQEKYHLEKIPNEETLQAMKDAEEGVNLTECKDIEELFKKLGLPKC